MNLYIVITQSWGLFSLYLACVKSEYISLVMSVRPSALNNFSLNGWIFIKFHICVFFWGGESVEKIQVSLTSDRSTAYFTEVLISP